MSMHYAIRYRNDPSYKGVDVYYRTTVQNKPLVSTAIQDAQLFSTDNEAHQVARQVPVFDQSHCVADVIRVEETREVVRREIVS